MPTYDYVCEGCGRRTEVMHGVNAPGPELCEVCGGRMRKALSTPAIVFKGSGWAKKDARAKSAPSTGASGGSKDGDTSAGDGEKGTATSRAETTAAPAAESGSGAADA